MKFRHARVVEKLRLNWLTDEERAELKMLEKKGGVC